MTTKPHHSHVYNTFEEFIAGLSTYFDKKLGRVVTEKLEPRYMRHAQRTWKQHQARNGNVPLIQQCGVCSGREHRLDIKHGKWKLTRSSKTERDELKGQGKGPGPQEE